MGLTVVADFRDCRKCSSIHNGGKYVMCLCFVHINNTRLHHSIQHSTTDSQRVDDHMANC